MRLMIVLMISLCFVAQAQNPNDCTDAILLCGDTDIGITPNGVGFNEFTLPGNNTPACYNFNGPQAWFRVEFDTAGTFSFTLSPNVTNADYDFAIFGPNVNCTNLGTAIRCSSTNPAAAGVTGDTGLNAAEVDVNEGPGPAGNGFLRELDVQAGESYYILIGLAAGAGGFSMQTSGTADLPPSPTAGTVSDFDVCDNLGTIDGFGSLDFSSLDAQIISGQPNVTLTYHENLNDANIGVNPISFPFNNTVNPSTIYARLIRTDSNCTDIEEFVVTVDDDFVNTDLDDITICSDNVQETFDFDTVIADYVTNPSNYDITYHNSLTDAENDMNAIASTFTVTNTVLDVFIRVEDLTGVACDYVMNTSIYLVPLPPLVNIGTVTACDEDFDGMVSVNLSDYESDILGGNSTAGYSFDYYETSTDRVNNVNQLSVTIDVNQPSQDIYVVVTDTNTDCESYTDYTIQVEDAPVLSPQEDVIVCAQETTPYTIEVPTGFSSYEWSTMETTSSIEITQAGIYTVTVTNAAGCEASIDITAIASDTAMITDILINDFNRGNNNVDIIVDGIGIYEYSLDGTNYQLSPVFTGLEEVYYTAYIRDINGCGVVTQDFVVLDYPQYFTPNNDGYHDFWKIEGLETLGNARLFIYDRYGKLLKQSDPTGIGFDGTYNGTPLPSSTYWFTLTIEGRKNVSGYFALKR